MEEKKDEKNSKEYWEKILAEEGLAPIVDIGQHPLGDGLGDVSPEIDRREEGNKGHGPMCPINLGHSIGDIEIDQPNDNPVEEEVIKKEKNT